jgi:hypothetical protein
MMAKHFLLGREGVGVKEKGCGERKGARKEGVMSKSLYIHMNKGNKKTMSLIFPKNTMFDFSLLFHLYHYYFSSQNFY